MGRPFEQWHRPAIAERWGLIDRYVHEDQGVPLVVSDDDISGTLTFIRALEDSGLYADTPDEAFGDCWLNYIMERRTILWWGGYGMSTEHTAYLNLKNGIKSPQSGAFETNGKPVAEQIGAQIFIDAYGMVAPGKPEMAVRLARKSARVSHDGEAVHAACVVAAMVSAAFVEKDMDQLLDIGIEHIPGTSEIAALHRQVRGWCNGDMDWEKTYERIHETYGYQKYGGTCHVIPNHAIMVMAWCYAPDSFYDAQVIINSAGWDTDCNAANVGAVMGIKVGLDRINESYEFQKPFGDRLIIPTAEPTRSVSDVLNEALIIAAIGRRIMGMPPYGIPKNGALHHFEMPGAQHGYLVDEDDFTARNTTRLENVPHQSESGSRTLQIRFENLKKGRVSRTSTPILPTGPGAVYGSAQQIQASPRIYPGNTIRLKGFISDDLTGRAVLRIYLRISGDDKLTFGDAQTLKPGTDFEILFPVPQYAWPVQDLGLEISGVNATGSVYIDAVWVEGSPSLTFPDHPDLGPGDVPLGWISDVDNVLLRSFSADTSSMMRIGRNDGRGVMITGNKDWKDYTFSTSINVHLAQRTGIIIRYQGLLRYIALIKDRDSLTLIEIFYGETVLASIPIHWEPDTFHRLRLTCSGNRITAYCDDQEILTGESNRLTSGGVGYLIENGLVGFRETTIAP